MLISRWLLLGVLSFGVVSACGSKSGGGADGGAGGSGGVMTGDPSGPRILSASSNVTTVTERDMLTITVVATDPDGIDDLIGGTITVAPSGASYGALQSSAAEGAYSLTLTWQQINAVGPIDAGPTGIARSFRIHLFDVAGHETTADIMVTLRCATSGTTACAGACLALATDKAHCGTTCANQRACPAAQACTNGACVCGNGGTLCGSYCVDTRSDETNCGACGRTCPDQSSCTNGSCVGFCPTGQTSCSDGCVDVMTNSGDCGACDHECLTTETCSGGRCIPSSCATGQMYCADVSACVDTASDQQHCGSCTRACGAGQTCTSGSCRCTDPFLTLCSGQCVDADSDRAHCGGCSIVCGASESCVDGFCG